jgi:hypothetical protein
MTGHSVRAVVVKKIIVDAAKADMSVAARADLKARAVNAEKVVVLALGVVLKDACSARAGVAIAARGLSVARRDIAVLVVTALHGVRVAAVNEVKHGAVLKACIAGRGHAGCRDVQVVGQRRLVRAGSVI